MTSGWEIYAIIALAVVLFGGSRLPKIARNLGRAQGELKKGLSEGNAAVSKDDKPEGNATPQA